MIVFSQKLRTFAARNGSVYLVENKAQNMHPRNMLTINKINI